MDGEATISSLQADRDKIAFELDYTLAREQEDLEMLGAVGETPSGDPFLYDPDDGCSASYNMEPPQRVRKQPRRHFSDLTGRDAVNTGGFGGLLANNASWSDFDVPTLASNDFGSGRLKRSTNFSNINNLDESESYDDDNRSMISDSVCEIDGGLEPHLAKPSGKLVRNKWQSFGSDSGEWQDVNERHSPVVRVSSAVSDLCAWQMGTDTKELPQHQSLKENKSRKNDSCQSSSSACFSDSANKTQADMWSFTPDSIINVSTGKLNYLQQAT